MSLAKCFFPRFFLFATGWLLLNSCGIEKRIVQKPIVFDAQRVQLTKEYLQKRYNMSGDTLTILPKMIVVHHTVIPTFQKTFQAFNPSVLPNWRPDIERVSGLNVSSHYVVDRDGTIYQLMPETFMARHVIGLNHCAIGIENVGGGEDLPLTKAQLRATTKLVYYLAKKYDIEYLIGHYEYTRFEGHPLWLEVDGGYRTKKDDPSMDFMKKVRDATKKLAFKAVPVPEGN